jgi:drug/metabolite transporter (DMT)-like permease
LAGVAGARVHDHARSLHARPAEDHSVHLRRGRGSVVSTLTGLFILPFDTAWVMPSPFAWTLMVISAAFIFVATTFMTVGLRTGEIAVVAPFRYVPVPLALLLGFWLWGDVPDAAAWLGIALVLGAGLYTLHRERASLKRAAVPAAAE